MQNLLDFLKENFWLILIIGISIAAISSFIRAMIELIEYLRFYHHVTSPEAKNTLYATTECEGIVNYYVYIRKESDPEEEKQLLKAQLNSITHMTEKLIGKKKYQTVISKTTYELQKVQLPDGSDIHFVTTNETTKQHFAPELTMNHETLVTSSDDEKFYVTLTPDAVILHEEITTSECDGILFYPVKVRNANSDTTYDEHAEVKSITTTTEKFTPTNKFEVISERTNYYLQRICWKSGGRSSFIEESSPGNYTSPLLQFGTEMTVTAIDGKTYCITVSKERIEMPKFIYDQIESERNKINRLKKSVANEIAKMIKNSEEQHKIAADIIADYDERVHNRIVEELREKPRPALKAAEEVQKIAKKLKKIEKEYLTLKYSQSQQQKPPEK